MTLLNKLSLGLIGSKESDSIRTKSNNFVEPIPLNDFWNLFLGGSGTISKRKAFEFYNKSSAVYIPINKIVEQFINLEPVLFKKNEDGTETAIKNHEIINLLNNPSADFDAHLFRQAISTNYLVTGESYITAIGNVNRAPFELMPTSPLDANPLINSEGFIGTIIISGQRLNGSYVRNNKDLFLKDQFTQTQQVRNFSTQEGSAIRGQSPLTSARDDVLQQLKTNNYNIKTLDNGGNLSLMFTTNLDLDTEDFKSWKNEVREQYGTQKNSVGALDRDTKVQEFGKTAKEMAYAELSMMTKQAIALVYNVPLSLVSLENSSFNNVSTSKLSLYDDAVLPLSNKLYGSIGNLLLPRFNLDPKIYRIGIDENSVPALRTRKNEELKLRTEANVETKDELRDLVNRKPLDTDGSQTLFISATMISIDDAVDSEDNPKVMDDDTDE